MRFVWLILVLALNGCGCAEDARQAYMNGGDVLPQRLAKICTEMYRGPCPTAADIEAEALAQAKRQWHEEGRCSGVTDGTWFGGTWIHIGGGWCGALYTFDRGGTLVHVRHQCEAEVHEYGWSMGADASSPSSPTYCDRVRLGMSLKGARLRVVDGLSVDGVTRERPRRGQASYELAYGPHTITAGGRTGSLEVIDGPGHQVLLELGPGQLPWKSGTGDLLPGERLVANSGRGVQTELPDGTAFSFEAWDWVE